MFATKEDAANWIKVFGRGLKLHPKRHGKHWVIYDSNGMRLSSQQIDEIEDNK